MNHLAFECAALVILGGIEFEETEHGVQAVDVQAGGSIKDTRDNHVSIFSPCHQHLLRTKVFYVQVQSTLFIHCRTLRFVVDEHHIRRGSCLNIQSNTCSKALWIYWYWRIILNNSCLYNFQWERKCKLWNGNKVVIQSKILNN